MHAHVGDSLEVMQKVVGKPAGRLTRTGIRMHIAQGIFNPCTRFVKVVIYNSRCRHDSILEILWTFQQFVNFRTSARTRPTAFITAQGNCWYWPEAQPQAAGQSVTDWWSSEVPWKRGNRPCNSITMNHALQVGCRPGKGSSGYLNRRSIGAVSHWVEVTRPRAPARYLWYDL